MLRWQDFFINEQPAADPLPGRRKAIDENFRRGGFLAVLIIILETIFAAVDMVAMALKGNDGFSYVGYLTLYVLMLAINIVFLALAKTRRMASDLDEQGVRLSEIIILTYVAVNMCWGSLVALMDQRLYGQTLAFMVNMVACSVIFIIEWRRMLIPYALSSLILMAGLPFFQKDQNILIGHYINLSVFIIMAWLGSRLLYQDYHRNLKCNLDLEQANQRLEEEIGQNRLINDKLNKVNFQLRNLSMVDELTSVANRRGLRNFIDQAFAQQEQPVTHMGALMVDIDHFKQFNDSFGHSAGDQALVEIARRLEGQLIPPLEMVARWGGEEFIFISFLREENELHELAEAIRQEAEKLADQKDSNLAGPLTVSIGTGYKSVDRPSDVGPVIEDADMAMYSAKRAGRNKIWSLPARIRIIPVTTPEQIDDLASLARKIWLEHYTPLIGTEQAEYMLEKFQSPQAILQDIQELEYQYDLISYQDEWAGYMAACPDDSKKAFFLSKLYVDSMYRGNHLARKMLDHLSERCLARGYTKIWLTVNKHNENSIAAYKKMGFVRGKPVVKDIGGGFVMDDYIMTLTLEN
jgi:diguanylate cyclase (GGDEF)-like protein